MQRSSGLRLLKEPSMRTYDVTDMLSGDEGLHASVRRSISVRVTLLSNMLPTGLEQYLFWVKYNCILFFNLLSLYLTIKKERGLRKNYGYLTLIALNLFYCINQRCNPVSASFLFE